MKILILGITGMRGHAVWLNLRDKHETFGTVRYSVQELSKKSAFFKEIQDGFHIDIDEDGKLVGLEVLDATDRYALSDVFNISTENLILDEKLLEGIG